MSDDDRKTISVSAEGNAVLRRLVQEGWFAQEVDAFQTAVVLALADGLSIANVSLSDGQTKFNQGSLDPRLREVILTFGEDSSNHGPLDKAVLLAEVGLKELRRVLDDEASLSAVLGLTAAAVGDDSSRP